MLFSCSVTSVYDDFFTFYLCDADLRIKGLPDDFLCDDLRSPGMSDLPVFHEEEAVAQIKRLIEIMQGREDGDALLPCRAAGFVNDELFVCNVEIAGRFVEYQQARLLCKCAGNGDFLPLAAGKLFHIPGGKFLQLHIPENGFHSCLILLSGFEANLSGGRFRIFTVREIADE